MVEGVERWTWKSICLKAEVETNQEVFISILVTIHDDLHCVNASTVGADVPYDI
jgi:hypothetical protein